MKSLTLGLSILLLAGAGNEVAAGSSLASHEKLELRAAGEILMKQPRRDCLPYTFE